MIHAGEEKAALDYARRTIDAFERAQVDTVVSNAAGCGSNLKDYGYLLRDDPKYSEPAKAFSAKCRDISEVLAALEPQAPRHPLPLKVAYHDACHLQHAQGVRTQPRTVLGKIPELQILETAEAALCCGSAGIYNLVRPGPAKELGDRKVRNVLATAPDLVASGNPGCLRNCAADFGSPEATYRWFTSWKLWTLRFGECRRNPCSSANQTAAATSPHHVADRDCRSRLRTLLQ
jgi:glycolate oxidase iron-sulfur subunit